MSSVKEQVIEDGVFEDVESSCVALVPTTQELHWVAKLPLPRPDPSFVTQLIATAEHMPQTRGLRRATAADAQTAYRANQKPVYSLGGRTRQTI